MEVPGWNRLIAKNKYWKMLKTKTSLKNFFIFNSTFYASETDDHKKILFFYPEVHQNEKLKEIGFVEAVAKFSGSFSFEQTTVKDVLTIKTTKTLKLFFEPEKDFWMVLVSYVVEVYVFGLF